MIIDGHSHIGEDYYHGYVDIDEYLRLVDKIGINYSLIMPTPNPVKHNKEVKLKYSGWYISNNSIVYYSETSNELKNPYMEENYRQYEIIQRLNRQNLFFIPIVHPNLDTAIYLEKLLNDINPIAFKIHGMGSGTNPNNIPIEFTSFIRKHNIPLIIHTDYDNGESICNFDTFVMRNINRADKWAKYLIKEEITGVLNHGCLLNEKAYELINNSSNIKVALGPDLLISQTSNRLMTNINGMSYLCYLKNKVKKDKIVFDIDFDWNRDMVTNKLDYDFLLRIEENWPSFYDKKLIYCDNLLNHFFKLNESVKKMEMMKNAKIK